MREIDLQTQGGHDVPQKKQRYEEFSTHVALMLRICKIFDERGPRCTKVHRRRKGANDNRDPDREAVEKRRV